MDRVAALSNSRPHAICSPPQHPPTHASITCVTLLGPLIGQYLAPKPPTTSPPPHRRRRHPPVIWEGKMVKSLDFTNASLRSMKHATDTTMTRTQHERVTNMTHAAAMTTRTSLFLFVLGDVVTMQTLQSLQTTVSGLASGLRALSTCI